MNYSPDELAGLRIGAPALLKTLNQQMQMTLDQIYGDFCAGKTDFLARVAEYSALRKQIFALTTALNKKGE